MTVPPALPPTMTVWRQHRYGTAEAVAPETVPVPAPRSREVIVRMRAVSLNAGDIHLMRGEPRLVRLFFGLRRPRVRGRGMDLAGTVVAVGAGVGDLAVGDEVVGAGTETLADYVAIRASRLVRRPDAVTPAAAACLPVAGCTAVAALEAARVRAGQRILVLGAGGGVGTLTVQLAADRGAEVWATCGARAEQILRAQGAARTVDYRTTPLQDLPAASFDAVIDIAGEPPLASIARLLRPGGRTVVVGGDGHAVWGPVPRMLRAAVRRGRIRFVTSIVAPEFTADLMRRAAAGRVTPVVEKTWSLADARAALASVEAGHTVGKVVVTGTEVPHSPRRDTGNIRVTPQA